jgi:hypothetical protein
MRVYTGPQPIGQTPAETLEMPQMELQAELRSRTEIFGGRIGHFSTHSMGVEKRQGVFA